ncbi:Uncharacterised protein [uncultured archaeon]|nr:Uncharacterised protein [uncultured archaeon]
MRNIFKKGITNYNNLRDKSNGNIMSITIDGYEFDGPYNSLEDLEDRSGFMLSFAKEMVSIILLMSANRLR